MEVKVSRTVHVEMERRRQDLHGMATFTAVVSTWAGARRDEGGAAA